MLFKRKLKKQKEEPVPEVIAADVTPAEVPAEGETPPVPASDVPAPEQETEAPAEQSGPAETGEPAEVPVPVEESRLAEEEAQESSEEKDPDGLLELRALFPEEAVLEGLEEYLGGSGDDAPEKPAAEPDAGSVAEARPETPEEPQAEAVEQEPAAETAAVKETSEEPAEPASPKTEEADPDAASVKKNIASRKLRRIIRRYRPDPLKMFILLGCVVIALIVFSFSSAFRIDTIEVEGNAYYTEEEIINMAHASTGKNLIYQAGINDIRSYLGNDPYIMDVQVSRKLPHTLKIRVTERRQVAAVVYGKEYVVIDGQGLILRRTDTEPKLTILRGIKISKMDIGQKMEAEDPVMLEKALEILAAMQEGDIYFIKIVMSERYIKAYIYDALVCTGLADNLIEVIRNDRLHQVVEALFERNIKRGTVAISTDGFASFTPDVN